VEFPGYRTLLSRRMVQAWSRSLRLTREIPLVQTRFAALASAGDFWAERRYVGAGHRPRRDDRPPGNSPSGQVM
jgi:hypothetical protein